jgi:hypothetical protein
MRILSHSLAKRDDNASSPADGEEAMNQPLFDAPKGNRTLVGRHPTHCAGYKPTHPWATALEYLNWNYVKFRVAQDFSMKDRRVKV